MNRAVLAELLRAFDAAGGLVELADGDLRLTSSKRAGHELLGEMRAARFDLVELLDGRTRCTFCDVVLDRHGAPGRVLAPDLGAHTACLAEHHSRRRALDNSTAVARRMLLRASGF